MNYYLARDGQTYGPYSEESIPGLLQQGQLVPHDLVCPEGGTTWVELSQVPGLAAIAAPAPAPAAAGSRLRVASAPKSEAPPTIRAHAPAALPGSQTSTLEKVANTWGMLKLIGYGVIAVGVAAVLLMGYFASQREQKEIAKLHRLPGWKAFHAGNSQINSESATTGFGSTSDAERLSRLLAAALQTAQKENFVMEKSSRRGRGKIGRAVSAVDSATAGTGHFQTFVELRGDRALVLVHVPEFSRYKGEAREDMRQLCWEMTSTALRVMARKNPDFTLVVGVRDKSSYDCVFLENLKNRAAVGAAPKVATGNVTSHQSLVKWFGEEKP